MSATQIIAELPKLTPAERRRVAHEIFVLEPEAAVLDAAAEAADRAFQMLDTMEAEDAAARQR